MVSKEDNELLTRIGPGTPMGNLFRQYWLPALISSELPEPDGPPKRMKILGEDLIAFRSTSGRVGLLAAHCSHRGASLFFGRNEEDGLRCVYHGWKYDVDGRCVDMPNEPPEQAGLATERGQAGPGAGGENQAPGPLMAVGPADPLLAAGPARFCDRIRHTAYPCREVNGAIWAYMGPRKEPPPLPDLEWTQVPQGHYALGKTLRECNWLQALEGDVDNAHVPFLHARLQLGEYAGSLAHEIMFGKKQIHLEVVPTRYGAMYGARRDADEERYNWRIIQFLFPSFSMITTGEPGVVPSHMWVPMDDENTMQWGIRWNPTEPLPVNTAQSHPGDYLPNGSGWLDQWQPVANRFNDYLIDREDQRTKTFSGISSIPLQDKAATESMGRIIDRTHEHLGTTDAMLMRVRRRLLEAARALRDDDVTPPGVDEPEIYRVRSAIVNLPKEVSWIEATRDTVRAFTGLPAASAV